MTGNIKRIISERGFGFIVSDEGGADLFFHVSDLDPELEWGDRLTEQRVQFDAIEGEKGFVAKNVRSASW